MLRPLPLLSLFNVFSAESGHGGGNIPAELLTVGLFLLVIWGVFRVTKKRPS